MLEVHGKKSKTETLTEWNRYVYGNSGTQPRTLMRNNKKMMLVQTYVSSSPIEGVGVFSAEHIRKGQLICRLEPNFDALFKINDVAGWPPHMDEFIRRYCYRHRDLLDTWVLELDNGRFMNHSDCPNTNFEAFYTGYAISDIEIGEELTCNYFDFDVDFKGSFVNVDINAIESVLCRKPDI
jgi:hypothetical protein